MQLSKMMKDPLFHAEGGLSEPIWICGLEPGIDKKKYAEDPEAYRRWYDERFLPYTHNRNAEYSWSDSFTYSFGQKVGWVFRGLQGHNARSYAELKKFRAPVFKTNLWPLSFPDVSSHHWQKLGVPELFGIDNKVAYRLECERTRHRAYAAAAVQHAPRLILCFGSSYVMDFARCFAGPDHVDDIIEYDWARTVYKVSSTAHATEIWVLPFAGRPLNSYDAVNDICARMRQESTQADLSDLRLLPVP